MGCLEGQMHGNPTEGTVNRFCPKMLPSLCESHIVTGHREEGGLRKR